MPGLNRRGPNGEGPMTGRRMGRCNPDNKGKIDDEILLGIRVMQLHVWKLKRFTPVPRESPKIFLNHKPFLECLRWMEQVL